MRDESVVEKDSVGGASTQLTWYIGSVSGTKPCKCLTWFLSLEWWPLSVAFVSDAYLWALLLMKY